MRATTVKVTQLVVQPDGKPPSTTSVDQKLPKKRNTDRKYRKEQSASKHCSSGVCVSCMYFSHFSLFYDPVYLFCCFPITSMSTSIISYIYIQSSFVFNSSLNVLSFLSLPRCLLLLSTFPDLFHTVPAMGYWSLVSLFHPCLTCDCCLSVLPSTISAFLSYFAGFLCLACARLLCACCLFFVTCQ